jgi:hypothetical protein
MEQGLPDGARISFRKGERTGLDRADIPCIMSVVHGLHAAGKTAGVGSKGSFTGTGSWAPSRSSYYAKPQIDLSQLGYNVAGKPAEARKCRYPAGRLGPPGTGAGNGWKVAGE